MNFSLQIVTPDGLFYDGEARRITVRAFNGDVSILARHCNYVVPLGVGVAEVLTQSGARKAACAGGMLSVADGRVFVAATTFEWADSIDIERARNAKARAEEKIKSSATDYEMRLAEAKLKKSLARISAYERR